MGGRNAQPISILSKKGNKSHKTKATIEARKNSEIKLGNSNLERIIPPDYVKKNKVAYAQWTKLLRNYKDAAKNGHELLSSTDLETLAKYCITHSEYLFLIAKRDKVTDIPDIDSVARLDTFLKLESAINKKHDILIKLEDRLFLNPLSKIKNVPKVEAKKKNSAMEDDYDL